MKELNLALQGGGSHGAFTWGVLDRLLEQDDLRINGISATSAGAVNAALFVYGVTIGGREKARELLAGFWRKVSKMSIFSPIQPTLIDRLFSKGNMDFNPIYMWISMMGKIFSPYQLNPFNINLLKDLIREMIDFKELRSSREIQLYISATNVKTGKIKIFDLSEITADAVMASACLPYVFHSVKINGEHYWDGGFLGNPAIFPLFYGTSCRDILIVQISPLKINEVPYTAADILDRATDVSFNSSLMAEIRSVHFVNKLVEKGYDDNGRLKKVSFHSISAEDITNKLNNSSIANMSPDFLAYLHNAGREKTSQWIGSYFDEINVKSTCDVEQTYL